MGIEEDEVNEKNARKYVVAYDSLCERVDRCTCGAGPGGYHGAHEPGCGLEFIASLARIFDALTSAKVPGEQLCTSCDHALDRCEAYNARYGFTCGLPSGHRWPHHDNSGGGYWDTTGQLGPLPRNGSRIVQADDPGAQPPPEVSPAAEVAAVLAGLVEEMTTLNAELRAEERVDMAHGVRWSLRLVERAQAATGARAAGGELMTVIVTSDPSSPPPNVWAMGRELRQAGANERAAQAAHRAFFGDCPIRGWDEINDEHRESWFAVARAVLAAAPPAPVAPGVAELLAECDKRLTYDPAPARMTCTEIVRLLAPGGADGTGEGT